MKFVLSTAAAAAVTLFAVAAAAEGGCSSDMQTVQTDQTVVASVPAPSTPIPATSNN